jgi:hypothetical protein
MTSYRFAALLMAGALLIGGVAACAESPADAPEGGASDTEATAPETSPEEPTLAAQVPEATEAEDEMPEGCMATTAEVLDVLAVQVTDAEGQVDGSAKAPLEVDEMIYGAWDVNAVAVTNKDGEQEVAVWVTKVLPPGEWSSAAGGSEPLAYAVNEVASAHAPYDMVTDDLFGRAVTMDDPEIMAAMDCLAEMESDG